MSRSALGVLCFLTGALVSGLVTRALMKRAAKSKALHDAGATLGAADAYVNQSYS
jgi:hypothetical protein